MKNECSIVQDLLPLYAEDLLSPNTAAFVEEHLQTCETCRAQRDALREKPAAAPSEFLPLQSLRQKLWVKRAQTGLLAAVLAAVLLCCFGRFMTVPRYLTREESGLEIWELSDGSLEIALPRGVNYEWHPQLAQEGEGAGSWIVEMSAYTSPWEQWQGTEHGRNIPLGKRDYLSVYYTANDGGEAQLLCGPDAYPDGGYIPLARLSLGYYLLAAVGMAALLAGLCWLLREKPFVGTLQKLFWLPVSYTAGHLLTKGLSTASYRLDYDLSMIVITAVLLYCATLLGLSLWRYKHPKPIL